MQFVPGSAIAVVAALVMTVPAARGADVVHVGHAMAMFGEPRYGPDFRHFDYVNPDAPKGGLLRLGSSGTFDSFNPYILRGNPADGVGAETLTLASADEPFTRYGLIAETMEWPDDRSWVVFNLRPEARWHDGRPITAVDVVFSFDLLKSKGAPQYRFYYASVDTAVAEGDRRVKFTFKEAGNRELPLIVGEMPILPKHYWQDRDFERTTLEPPLGSGPYRVEAFEAGRFVEVRRVADYWGRDLPVNVGQHNFERIRYEYFRDDGVIRQALKAGVIDFRAENQAKAWALDYDVPAVAEGFLIKEEIPHGRPTGMQAFVLNTRRPLFQDPRVRRALAYAFDFEWTNRTLFFGQYVRTESYFSNSELAARGVAEGEERALLERFRGRVPDAVFGDAFVAPVSDGSGWPRANLQTALGLLVEAGWRVEDFQLVDDTGRPFRFEILLVSQAFERIALPFVRNLARLGIEARVRLVDQSQYINRLRDYDFDVMVGVWGQSESPGNEQRGFWTTQAAAQPGSRNYAGIRDPVVDDLVDLLIASPDREALVARTRALDRVLLAGHYVVPNWHTRVDRILWWDKFSRPSVVPDRGVDIDTWWFDAAKAAALEAREPPAREIADRQERGPQTPVVAALAALAVLALFAWRRLGRRPSD
jgi:microcin C transport system substrate-binding protein